MPQDGPTIPKQDWPAPGPAADAPVEPYQSPGAPLWPDARAHRSLFTESARAPRGYVSATLFGMSVGVNVALLIGLVGVVLLSYAGVFPSGGSGRLTPSASPSTQALGSPKASVTPSLSPTPGSGWLQVTPATVQLGCGDGQDSQTVVLRNTGPHRVSWQVAFSVSSDNAGVSVNPQDGRLDAGNSVEIHLQNTTQSNDQQGVIQFMPANQAAGSPANITYTTTACQ
jgi:hypothetical protein